MALPEAVVKAKEEGVEVLELTGEDGKAFYFRKPGKPDMNRYLASAAKQKLASAAQNLVNDLAISPDATEWKRMIDEKPGLMVSISSALQGAVGLNEEFEVKKL